MTSHIGWPLWRVAWPNSRFQSSQRIERSLASIQGVKAIIWRVHCNCINGPEIVEVTEGENAEFLWNNTCQKWIISATFGILKGNIADPQLLHVDIKNRKPYFNQDMKPKYKGRVDFTGNLAAGCAWFILKNLTRDDRNWYIASISDKATRILPYPVRLIVRKKEGQKGIASTTIPVSNTTNHRNTSTLAASPVATTSIYTGVKKSSSTTNKIFSAFIILIAILI